MKTKNILLGFLILLLLYPLISLFQMDQAFSELTTSEKPEKTLLNYQISIWISWILIAAMAVYFKWKNQKNLFFHFTYGFLSLAFIIFGIYTQRMVNNLGLPSRFEDNYTLGVFIAAQNILISAVLTGFLQAGVWWFTRKWHRS